MRVTTAMLINTVVRDLEDRLTQMAKRQEELSSGRRINRPSDDPGGVVSALRLRAQLGGNVQYKQNMDDAIAWLSTTDAALREAVGTLQRIREIAVAGSNQTLSAESLEALAKEVAQLKNHLGDVANTSYAGRYIFAGTKTLTPPYDPGTGTWNGTSDILEYEIAPGVTISVNIDGQAVFDSATLPKVFQVLDDLIINLQNGDAASISNNRIGEIDQNIDNILAVLAEVGARINRLEMAKSRMETTDVDLQNLLAQVEDTDMARALMDLKSQENVYRAALAVGARIVQPSLVDFLR
ncbi:MAG: flagellar hook-associated protein FlgL [Bacillota bacterium]|nr:flagellar hook-associated protein FlgL [Thermoanaerobacteraceae bacterium]